MSRHPLPYGRGSGRGSVNHASRARQQAVSALFCLLLATSLAWAQNAARPRVSAPGALLDDYTVSTPGTLSTTVGAFYERGRAGHDTASPAVDLDLGLTRWLDLSLSTSLTGMRFENFGTSAAGDSYISAKLVVVPEGRRRPGVAFQPVLEVLGRPSLANNALAPEKVSGVFGGIVGKSFDHFRIYNHSGYFTRGIAFSSAAVEFTSLFQRLTPVVYATFGALTRQREVAASLQNNVTQTNVGGSLGFRLSERWSGYVTAARGIGRRDDNTADYHLGLGISYTFTLWEAK